jgi:hypothetical protein
VEEQTAHPTPSANSAPQSNDCSSAFAAALDACFLYFFGLPFPSFIHVLDSWRSRLFVWK